jgi:hypothetical protein
MNKTRSSSVIRRDFLAGASAIGTASLLGFPRVCAAEPPPEVKKIRLLETPAICLAPMYLAEQLLHLEGFSEIEYVETAYVKTEETGPARLETGPAVFGGRKC